MFRALASELARRAPRCTTERHGTMACARRAGTRRCFARAVRSDYAVATQVFDLGGCVAGLGEDLVGVLAERRRLALDAGTAVRQPEAGADQAHRAVARVDGLQHVAVLELGMARDLLDLPHGGARHVGGGEARLPRFRIVLGEGALDDLAQRRLVLGPRAPVLEPRVVEGVGAADRAHERNEL